MKTSLIKPNKKKRILLLIIVLLLSFGYLLRPKIPQPPESVNNVSELDAYLEKLVQSGTPQGLSMLIVKNDSIVYNKGFGWADAPRKIKATPQTVYHWWSITKIPTAMAILQLEEQGKLQLDDPVSKYLDFVEVNYPSAQSKPVTIRHLLNHSSGIPDAGVFSLMKWIHHDNEPSLDQTAFTASVWPDYANLQFEPGEDTSYSNIGYMLLGAVIEKVSGQSYREYIRQHLLKPLKMEHTDFVYTDAMEPYEAAGAHPAYSLMTPLLYATIGSYIRETSNGHLWLERVYTDQEPSTALLGSTEDAARLMRAYLNKGELEGQRILSESAIEAMTNTSHVAEADDDGAYFFRQGIGWQVFQEKSGYKLQHTGGGPGFYTIMQIYPGDGLGLVLFCNDVTLEKYGWQILRLGADLEW